MGFVDRRLDKEKASFAERFPTLEHETELRRAYGSGDWYRDQVRQTTEFDQLFFPGHPDGWPALSVEAINAGSPQVDLIADYQREYERRLQVHRYRRADRGRAGMMMQLLRDFVMQARWSLADVKTRRRNGIPAELAMVIDGDDWTRRSDRGRLRRDGRVASASRTSRTPSSRSRPHGGRRQKLAAEGALSDDEAFRRWSRSIRDQMANSMFNMDFLALQGHGFPSLEAYEQHLRLVDSFKSGRKASALEITEDGELSPELAAHRTIANGIMGLAKARAETLLVSSFDWLVLRVEGERLGGRLRARRRAARRDRRVSRQARGRARRAHRGGQAER